MLSASDTPSAEPASGRIVFSRYDPALDNSVVYLIDPNGTTESLLLPGAHECPRWSPDGNDISLGWGIFENAGQPNGAFRAFTTLEHTRYLPDPTLNLGCPIWSPDGSRLAYQGWDDTDPTRNGIYTLNASDGGDLTSVLPSLPGKLDYVHVSTDGTELLVNRIFDDPDGNLDGTQFVVNVDGSGQRQLNPPGTVPVDLGDFWSDFDGRPRISETWSPDETQIAFTAFVTSAGSTALYLVNPDGSGPHQIVPTTVGATSAQWSPDGALIAFTSRLRSQPQVWVVRPDGSELKQLTDGADGSTSIMPVWSPDGTKLLFQRRLDGHLTLWTMNRDGSGQIQVAPTPLGSDYFGGGGYAWWPAPRK